MANPKRQCFCCRFYDHNSRCRRNPPFPVQTHRNDGYGNPVYEIEDYWPYVNKTDWCGEHKYDKRKLAAELLS
jgi:hypothetical protein